MIRSIFKCLVQDLVLVHDMIKHHVMIDGCRKFSILEIITNIKQILFLHMMLLRAFLWQHNTYSA